MIYLDHASTTPPLPAALDAMSRVASQTWGDPARLYHVARVARMTLDESRAVIASTMGARPEEIVFTSGGTESCNLAIRAGALAAAAARKPKRVVVSAVEHTSVLQTAHQLEAEGDFEFAMIPVDAHGVVDLGALEDECARGAGLVSIQHANHDVGTMQPVADAARIAREAGALFHTDAVMTVGHVPVDVVALGVDLLSASSHKSYGPRGAGILWARRGVRVRPQMLGDDRERRRRGGIENLAAIAGMAAALAQRSHEIAAEGPRLADITTRLRDTLPDAVPGTVVHGHPTHRLPGIVAFTVPDVDGEAMLLALDTKGIAVHSGSSCVSNAQEPSHVLAAIGAPTTGALRASAGRTTTDTDIDALLNALPPIVAAMHARLG